MIQVSLPYVAQEAFRVLSREVRAVRPLFEAGPDMRIYVWVILIGTQFLHDLIKRRQDLRFRYPVKGAAVPMLNVVNETTLVRSVNVYVSEKLLRSVSILLPTRLRII